MEKEVIIKLNGKWTKNINKLEFSAEDIKAIEQDFIEGKLLPEILQKNKLRREVLELIIKNYIHIKHYQKPKELSKKSTFILGKKSLQDFKSEEEMLNEKPYTWDNLSDYEKQFYQNYEK